MPSRPEVDDGPRGRIRPLGRHALRLTRRHWGLLVVLLLGGVLRGLVVHAYVPAFSFADSISYLTVAHTGEPQVHRPWGYSGLLASLEWLMPFRGVAIVQHVLGLVVTVLVYALLQHRGVRRLVSCLAVAPLALDGYIIQIEHYVMAESLYMLLLVGALVLLLWSERPSWWAAAGAGIVFGLGALTRTVGLVVVAVVAVYLLVRLVRRSIGWRPVVAAAVGVAGVLVPYMLWFHAQTGIYALTDYTGHFMYGRVAAFADCDKVDVPPRLHRLCPTEPVSERPVADWYVWHLDSPANKGRYSDADLKEFSGLILRGQPLDFATGTAAMTFHYFMPGRYGSPQDSCMAYWWFPDERSGSYAAEGGCPARLARVGFDLEPTEAFIRLDTAAVLAEYQRWVFTPGPVLGFLVLAGLSGLVPGRPRGLGRDRVDGVFLVVVGVALVAVPSATAMFDYRYGLPMLAVLPVAAALSTRRWLSGPPSQAGDVTGQPAGPLPGESGGVAGGDSLVEGHRDAGRDSVPTA
jgi:4-amino-4-deoxy-L-arabinose transferase-like glycosyltransferase